MENNTVVIGIGHKCRQGKDWLARTMQEIGIPGTQIHIFHFADALYKEAQGCGVSEQPLLSMFYLRGEPYIQILPDSQEERIIRGSLLPNVLNLMMNRSVADYWCMTNKDSEFLQIWGTDIRRNLYGQNYWVDKVKTEIEKIERLPGNHLILIPDTRFKNEYDLAHEKNGFYVEVVRLHANGDRYVATDRDPNHPSETALDSAAAHVTVVCTDGRLDYLKKSAENTLETAKRCLGYKEWLKGV